MKYFLSFLLTVLLCSTAMAQSEADKRVAEIRQAYAEASKIMVDALEDANLNNKIEIVRYENVPGSGPSEFHTELFFKNTYDSDSEDWERARPRLYFIRVRHRYAVLDFCYEYLVNSDTGELMFYYSNEPGYDEQNNAIVKELRLYFDQKRGSRPIDTVVRKIGEAEDLGSLLANILRDFNKYKKLFENMPPYNND